MPWLSFQVANTPEFVEAINRATGVWFGGGRQWRISNSYLGTAAQLAFERVLERGGVIGGSSAGAAFQGDIMIRGNQVAESSFPFFRFLTTHGIVGLSRSRTTSLSSSIQNTWKVSATPKPSASTRTISRAAG